MTDIAEISQFLECAGLADNSAKLHFLPLQGGVSSDIWHVTGGLKPFCVKRARSKLAVSATWNVPVKRNHFEAEFLRVVEKEVPGFAPTLLAEDESRGLIVISFFDPVEWKLWKTMLLDGQVDIEVARSVGKHLGRLASVTRDRADLADRFDTLDLFHKLRLDPYFLECARKHTDLATVLTELCLTTASRKESLVHGDVSPKNVLATNVSESIILDAECAWYGDPAFDLAFALSHLLLKIVHNPRASHALKMAIKALLEGHASSDTPEHVAAVHSRATNLLPALLLARVDGKSPVEYLTEQHKKESVRAVGRRFLLAPAAHPFEIVSTLTGANN